MAKSLTGLFYELFDNAMEGFETAMPGTVSAVNADGTVDVRPSVRNVLRNMQMEPADSDGRLSAIRSVPVLWPGTAATLVKFELAEGDPVLLVASSRDLREWKEGGWENDGKAYAPTSFAAGCDLNDLLAIPVRRELHGNSEPKVKLTVNRNGSVEMECKSVSLKADSLDLAGDLSVTGKIAADGEVTANAKTMPVNLSTHIHASAAGPTGAPTPNT